MKTRYLWLAAAVVITALLISGTAFADDTVSPDAAPSDPAVITAEVPTDPAVVVPPAPEVEEPVAVRVVEPPVIVEPAGAVVDTPQQADPLITETTEALSVVEAAPVEPVATEEVVLPAAEENPAIPETALAEEPVLADETGKPLVLATRESAEILESADPYFKSGGITYSFYQAAGTCAGAPHCFDGLANPIQAAVDYIHLNATPPDDGNINVEKAIYTGNVTVDGSLTTLNSLTGLIGISSAGLFPTISGSLNISNLTNGFYLNGFNVTGGVTIFDSSGKVEVENVSGALTMENVNASGSSGDGIHVNHHKGNIVLVDVTSNNNSNQGLYIEDQIAGNVTISNSQFQNNGNSSGVNLHAKGIVSINNVTADNNYSGFDLYTYSSLSITNSEANDNHTNGIYAGAFGKPVSFENVDANNNCNYGSYEGIYLDNAGAVAFKNVIANSNIGGTGMYISSTSTVTLTGNTAIDNNGDGIHIYSPSSAAAINGAVVNENGDSGLYIDSRGATLRNVIAVKNGGNGINLHLSSGSGLIDTVTASDNDAYGIYFDNVNTYSSAAAGLTINKATTNRDFGGLYLTTRGAVTITNSSVSDSNVDNGYYIATSGTVKLSNIWSGNNAGNGLKVEGLYTFDGSMHPISMASPASVTINISTASNNFNGFSNNGLADDPDLGMNGALIISQRPVVINNFYTNDNHNHGLQVIGPNLYISGGFLQQRSGAVTITSTIPNRRNGADRNLVGIEVYSAGTVTLSGLNTNDNTNSGVVVDTLGAIVLNNASDNHNDGGNSISLENNGSTVYMPVTINNLEVDNTQMSWDAALYVSSKGAITINALKLQDNNCTGAYLNNTVAGRGNITLSNANFQKNGGSGLQVLSNGSILLTNVNVYDSASDGATLSNNKAPTPAAITLTGCEFSRNGMYGLLANSKGVITLRDMSAYENSSNGIELFNNFSGATAGMVLTNVTAESNNGTGLYLDTNGSAALTTINTNNNAMANGVISDGQTVQDYYNQSHGLDSWVFEAEQYTEYIVYLWVDASFAMNRADFNPVMELYDSSDSPIAVSTTCFDNSYCGFDFIPDAFGYGTDKYYVRVGSDNNDGYYRLSLNDPDPSDSTTMFWVDSTDANALGSITVKGIEAHNNSLSGLWTVISGSGATALSDLHISDNGTEGVHISGNTGTITLSGDNFSHLNGWEGVIISTNGAVTISKLDDTENGHATGSLGLKIGDESSPKALSLSNINTDNNGGGGLWIRSTLGITLVNIKVSDNTNDGIYADNCLYDGAGNCVGAGNMSLNKVYAYNNQGTGMTLISKGNVSMTSVEAGNNWNTGLFTDNCLNDGSGNCAGSGTISLSAGNFNNNGSAGLEFYSKGSITLNTVEASGNGYFGANLSNQFNGTAASINLSAVTANNNNDTGVNATSHGSLVMANLDINNNAKLWGKIGDGQTVQDFYNAGKGPDRWEFTAEFGTHYTLLLQADGYGLPGLLNQFTFDPEIHLFSENGDEVTTGISIIHGLNTYHQFDWDPGFGGDGTYYVEASSTTNSGFYRLSINDPDPSDSTTKYFVDGLAYQVDGNVTMTGINTFNDNADAGLIGWNNGTVALANASAFDNGAEGVYVDNQGGTGNVTISGLNMISGNGWEGLRVDTNGAVSIATLDSSNNGQDGIRIKANTSGKAVTLLNVTGYGNNLKGLDLVSNGKTTLNNFRGWFNTGDGANINTNGYNLTVLNSTFMCNNNYGLAFAGHPAPFTFTNTGNIYLCNGSTDLIQYF